MKEIVINNDNLKEEEINRLVKRAKLFIENTKGEIFICRMNNNYFFLGGHVDNDETDIECLKRELKEEAGVVFDLSNIEKIMTIKYYNRDYPENGFNSKTIANYYYLKYALIPNIEKQNLTDEEIKGNFTILNIPKDKVIEELENNLDKSTRPEVTKDTLEVLSYYLNL